MKYDFEKLDKKRKELYDFIRQNGLAEFFDEYSGIDQLIYDLEYITLWESVCKKIVAKQISLSEAKKIIDHATNPERDPLDGFPRK